jgi:hypothetical protein
MEGMFGNVITESIVDIVGLEDLARVRIWIWAMGMVVVGTIEAI